MTGKAKVIAFANQKGGVAKTTTTLNLAAAFAEEGHRVLCVPSCAMSSAAAFRDGRSNFVNFVQNRR